MLTGMPSQIVSQAQSNVYSQLGGSITSEAGIDAAMSQLEGALALGKTTLDAAKGDGTYDAYLHSTQALQRQRVLSMRSIR